MIFKKIRGYQTIKATIFLFLLSVLVLGGTFFYLQATDTAPRKIGWFTDIHAGGQRERRQTDVNTIFPTEYAEYFDAALKELRGQGIVTAIATGDNTNIGEQKYAERLAEITKANEMSLLWAKGNHDRDKYETMKYLGAPGNYYFYDIGYTRIVVLDNSNVSKNPNGTFDDDQSNWFTDLMRNTKWYQKIIIAMHVPIFDNDDNDTIFPQYLAFEEIVRESKKVILVLSGHSHREYKTTIGGINYWTGNPLTLKDHKGSYYIIDRKKKTVESHNAQL